MLVRPALEADIPAMHAIRLAVQENRLSDPQRIGEDSYRPHVANGGAWLAEVDGRPVGFAILDAAMQNVWALFVHPQAERAGIGRALEARMLAWAQQRGLDRLWLATSPGTRAEHFYAASGWTRAGLTDTGEVRFERTISRA